MDEKTMTKADRFGIHLTIRQGTAPGESSLYAAIDLAVNENIEHAQCRKDTCIPPDRHC